MNEWIRGEKNRHEGDDHHDDFCYVVISLLAYLFAGVHFLVLAFCHARCDGQWTTRRCRPAGNTCPAHIIDPELLKLLLSILSPLSPLLSFFPSFLLLFPFHFLSILSFFPQTNKLIATTTWVSSMCTWTFRACHCMARRSTSA